MTAEKCSCGTKLYNQPYNQIVAHIHGEQHLGHEGKKLELKRPFEAWNWVVLDKAETIQFEKNFGNVRVWSGNDGFRFVVDLLTYFSATMRKNNPFEALSLSDRYDSGRESFPWGNGLSEILPQQTRYSCTLELMESESFRKKFAENAYEISSVNPLHREKRLERLGQLEDFFGDALRSKHMYFVRKIDGLGEGRFNKIELVLDTKHLKLAIVEFIHSVRKLQTTSLTTHLLALFAGDFVGVSAFARNDWSTFEPWFEDVLVWLVQERYVAPTEKRQTMRSVGEWVFKTEAQPADLRKVRFPAINEYWEVKPKLTQKLAILPRASTPGAFSALNSTVLSVLKNHMLVTSVTNEVDHIMGFCAQKKNLAYALKEIPCPDTE